jgi:leader peptidase (prepilin peptidase)/N-methyltransferase
MFLILGTLFFTLGLVIGSFINALSFRYNSGKSILTASACFSCGEKLKARDLVPVLSFLFLKGKCRDCGSKISVQYPLVELITGAVFLLIYVKIQDLLFVSAEMFVASTLVMLAFWAIFIFIAVYDFKHKIVPDGAVYTMSFIAISDILWRGEFIRFFYGFILFTPFFLLWFLSRGRLMGLGDGKIALALGLLLPIAVSSSGVILSFWIGALYAVFIMSKQRIGLNKAGKKTTMKSELPFVPFMFLGSFAAFYFGLDILSLNLWI